MTVNYQDTTAIAKTVKQRSLSVLMLTVLLLCSALLNIVLGRKIKDLNFAISYLKTEIASMRGLNPGDQAPPIQGKDVTGQPITVMHIGSDAPSIIYIFTPSCKWCTRNLSNIKTLLAQTRENHRFIGLSLSSDGLKEYATQHDLVFPIYTDLTGNSASAYKGGTPRTLVVSPGGTILKSWFGAYTGELQREVEEYFKIRLPGVVEAEPQGGENNKSGCKTCDEENPAQS
jgi:peroxiredoxin